MVDVSSKPLVVITGVTGFLGSMVLNEFLCGEGAGKYRIRATVRDKNNENKLAPLQKFFGDILSQVEFVNANLDDKVSLYTAIQGADYVVHTASPVGANPKNHEDMIRPAVNGVTYVMEAATQHKVKRVVITSSASAVTCMAAKDRPENGYDEKCWSDVEAYNFQAYTKSKTLAEKAAWQFCAEREAIGDFYPELVTICPTLILGEVIGSGDVTSAAIVRRMVMNEIPGWPDINFNYVDVKDCSLAHLRAIEVKEAASKRFILSKETGHQYVELARMLEEALIEHGYNYSIRTLGLARWMVKFGSFFSNELSSVLFLIDEPIRVMINTQSRDILGIQYKRTAKELVFAAAESMIKSGSVPLKLRK